MTTNRLTASGPRGHQRLHLARPDAPAEAVIVREMGVMLVSLARAGGPDWATVAQAARTVERLARDRSMGRAAEVTSINGRLLPEFAAGAVAISDALEQLERAWTAQGTIYRKDGR